MKILVTGADGFVGSWLLPMLTAEGHEVVAGLQPEVALAAQAQRRGALEGARSLPLELLDAASIRSAIEMGWDAVVHLAALASGSEAQRNPLAAWEINTLGTVRVAEALGALRSRGEDPLLLLVSTAEVYGAGTPDLRVETDPVRPCSPYAASKLGAEIAALEVHRRTGLRVVVARAFPHSGPRQDTRFVVPAFAQRLLDAKRSGAREIRVGDLSPVRDFLHVADVAGAYARLLDKGRAGEVYNVASGRSVSVGDLLSMLADVVGFPVTPVPGRELLRPVDIPHLVGDSTKLRTETGWQPANSLEEMLRQVVDAQAN